MSETPMGQVKYDAAARRIGAATDDLEVAITALWFYFTATPYDLDYDGAEGTPSVAQLALEAVGEIPDA